MTAEQRERYKRAEAREAAEQRELSQRTGGYMKVESTDPYEVADEHPDKLRGRSSTPLMSGGWAGLLRVSALGLFALVLLLKRGWEGGDDVVLGGLPFPQRIQVPHGGGFKQLLGGGPLPPGAIGVYLQPAAAVRGGTPDWGDLASHVGRPVAQLAASGPFFAALGAPGRSQALVLQFDGAARVAEAVEQIARALPDGPLAPAIQLALPPPSAVPARGARLYVTCAADGGAHATFVAAPSFQSLRQSTHVPKGGITLPREADAAPGSACAALLAAWASPASEPGVSVAEGFHALVQQAPRRAGKAEL